MAGPTDAVQLMTVLATMAVPTLNTMIIYDPVELPKTMKGMMQNPKSVLGAAVNLAKGLNKAANSLFRFHINPQSLTISKDKVQSVVLTKGGYDQQFWRNKMVSLAYKGRSGYFRPPSVSLREQGVSDSKMKGLEKNSLMRNVMNDTRLSYAWLKFQRFQEFYDTAEGDLVVIFDGIFYTGFFESFSFVQAGETPYVINYDFKFLAYPDKIYNLFTKVPPIFTAL